MSYRGEIQANTQITVKIGPYLDSTNGNDNETGLSISQADIRLSKNGGNFAQVTHNQGGGNLTHDELGYYDMTLNTTDTNAEGRLLVVVHESGALLVELSFNVLAQAAYASKYTPKDAGYMNINVFALGGGAQSVADLKDFADTGYDPATHKVQGVVLTDTTTVATDAEADLITIAEYLDTEIATIDGVVDDILSQVDTNYDEIGDNAVDIATLSATLLRYVMLMVRKDAAVKADAEAYLTAINSDLGTGGGAYDNETDSQEAKRDKLTDIDTKTTNLPTDPADASVIAAALATIAAYIDTEVQAIKDKTDNLPASPAAVGSEMTLENDAIKAAKYDESTAFPIKSVDTGDTEIARTGADGDTLEDLSDEIAAQVAGGGSETWEFTLTEAGSDEPVADANVWVTADEAGEGTVIVSGFTDTLGVVTFYLDTGTYYFWAEKSGWNFSNPYETEVS